MRPGRAADIPALLELWRSEVRAGRRDSAPLQPQAQTMLAQFDWEALSRVVEDGAGFVAGAVLVTSRESSEGTVARIEPAPVPVDGYELLDGSCVPEGSWAHVHNRSFADHWRFSPRSEEELMTGKVPRLCLMAVKAITGEPAAVTLCQLETYVEDPRPQPVGLVSSVGTVPKHRRHGLASWLVAEGLHRLQR